MRPSLSIGGRKVVAMNVAGRRSRRMLPMLPLLTLVVMLGPVLAGLAGTLAPALGWFPAIGGHDIGLERFAELLAWPGFRQSLTVSIAVGLGATAVSLAVVVAICAAWQGSRAFAWIERALSPLLSLPHAAAAFGLAFLIAPSGWLARLLSPWATGWEQPPDLLIVQDPNGLALLAGLVLKEVPFLLLMTLAALVQADATRSMQVARSLGYGRSTAWLKVVLPRVYPQIRLPVYAVLAYSASVVDVAVILGPSTPSTLAVQVLRWSNDPDLALRFRAAAGAIVQLLAVGMALVAWRVVEKLVYHWGRAWIERGGRGRRCGERWLGGVGLGAAILTVAAVAAGIAGLALWSMAGQWSFPSVVPDSIGLRTWERSAPELVAPLIDTLVVGALATVAALVLTLGCLEAEFRHGVRPSTRAMWLLYVPLLVPQVCFLLGLQTLALGLGLDGGRLAVAAAHLVFVLPYVFLSLADPWRAWDRRYATVAGTLGATPDRVLWAVRLPMLMRSLLTAAAVGLAVSVGQYLPTIMVGGGRVVTLTTEAVALASGGDRRVIGAYAMAQMALPLLAFGLALALPHLLWRDRRGLRPSR